MGDSLVQFQVMKAAIIIAIFLINVFMSKKYLINVNDKKEYQNGSDYSGAINFQITYVSYDGARGLRMPMFRSGRRRNEKNYVGSTLQIQCIPRRSIQSCEFRSPKGDVFIITKKSKFLNGRIESKDKIFPHLGCGIKVRQVTMEDQGTWSCSLKIPGVTHLITKKTYIKVHEKPGTPVRRNNLIGLIPSWGPYFKISLDLMVFRHSKNIWTSVLAFKANNGVTNSKKHGDRIPAIFLHKDGFIGIRSSINGNINYWSNHRIKLQKWHKIIMEQVSIYKKTSFKIWIDGVKVNDIKNSNPRTFSNVKVFAGDNFYPAADASYKNLVWESSWDRCPVVACPRLVVRGATYGSNDGEYKLVSQKVPWAKHRPLYKHLTKNRYLFWHSYYGYGWCFGFLNGGYYLCSGGQTGLSEVCEPWQEKWSRKWAGHWRPPVKVECSTGSHLTYRMS